MEFTQDVAFRTKTLTLDTGEKIIIPAVIRTVIPSRIIQQYLEYCKDQDFEPASVRSLYRMIEVCSASMQKSLQDLDNTTAEGVKAFERIVTTLESHNVDVSTLKTQLKSGKRYLKADSKPTLDEKNSALITALSTR